MKRLLNKLSAQAVKNATKPGRYADGGNLYLLVDPGGAKRWLFIFRWQGKQREMGLGSARNVSLALARERATAARSLLANGVSPLDAKVVKPQNPSFGAFADDLLDSLETGWRNPKHRAQWRMTLTKHAASLRAKPVDAITTEDVLQVLKAIWTSKPETASRLRGRIEKVLDAAKANGLRSGENPARWRGHLDHLLPKPKKLARGHHPALSFEHVPGFLTELRTRPAVAARALEFTILTAARSGEVLGARWSEIDAERAVWTIPKERMKGYREHRVPLGESALAIVRKMGELRGEDGLHVFPGQRPGRPLSNMAMEMQLRRMKRDAVTVHGFRSSFRDWAAETTSFPNHVVEMALAHVIGDKVEAAYRRGDLFEKRRKLMESWASFVEGTN